MNEIRRPIARMCDNNYDNYCSRVHVDPENVVSQFVSEYYRKVSNVGWNIVMHLFDQNSVVIIKNKNVGNSYNMLNFLSSENVRRANYDGIRTKWVVIEKTKLLINVFGQIQFVAFNGNVSRITTFAETFVLTIDKNGNVKCTHNLLDF